MYIIFNLLLSIFFIITLSGMEEERFIQKVMRFGATSNDVQVYFSQLDGMEKRPERAAYNFLGLVNCINKKDKKYKDKLFGISNSSKDWNELFIKLGYNFNVYNTIDLLNTTKQLLQTYNNFFEKDFIKDISNLCNSALIKILAGAWGIKFKPLKEFTGEELERYKKLKETTKGIGITAFQNAANAENLVIDIMASIDQSKQSNKNLNQNTLQNYHLNFYSNIAQSYLQKDPDFIKNAEIFARYISSIEKIKNPYDLLFIEPNKKNIMEFCSLKKGNDFVPTMALVYGEKKTEKIVTTELLEYLKDFDLEGQGLTDDKNILHIQQFYYALTAFQEQKYKEYPQQKGKKDSLQNIKQQELHRLLEAMIEEGFFRETKGKTAKETTELRQELFNIIIESAVNANLVENDKVYNLSFQDILKEIEVKKLIAPFQYNQKEAINGTVFELFLKYMGAITNKYSYDLIESVAVAKDVINEGVKLPYLSKSYNSGDILSAPDMNLIAQHIIAHGQVNTIKGLIYNLLDACGLMPKTYDNSSFLAETKLALIEGLTVHLSVPADFKQAVEQEEEIHNNFLDRMGYLNKLGEMCKNIMNDQPIKLYSHSLEQIYNHFAIVGWVEMIKEKESNILSLTEKESMYASVLRKEIKYTQNLAEIAVPALIDSFDILIGDIKSALLFNLDLEILNSAPLIKCEEVRNIPDKSKHLGSQYLFDNASNIKEAIYNQSNAINYWMQNTGRKDEWQRLLWLLIYRNQSL